MLMAFREFPVTLQRTYARFIARPALTIAGLRRGRIARARGSGAHTGGQDILHVARDGQRLSFRTGCASSPRNARCWSSGLGLPAHDRLSPHPDIAAERLTTLAKLAAGKKPGSWRIIRRRRVRPAEGATAQPHTDAAVAAQRPDV